MGERWPDPDSGARRNGVDYRVRSDAIEREWLTGLFSSVGQDRADAYALLARMRERRMMGLRKATLPVPPQKGGRR
jgi:hypothetical protein